jgi:hypothetical protein
MTKLYEIRFYCNDYKMLVACDGYDIDNNTYRFLQNDCLNQYIILRLHCDECDVNFIEDIKED